MKKVRWSAVVCLLLVLSIFGSVDLGFEVVTRARGSTIYVDDDGGADYTNIQDAIDAASYGDTVFVYSGTYIENLYIRTTINVIGENRDSTFIKGVYIPVDRCVISGFCLIKWSNGIDINGHYNTISGNNISSGNCGIEITGHHNEIYNNIVSNNCCDGINIGSSLNKVHHNNIYSNGVAGIQIGTCSGNSIYSNIIKENRYAGIILYESIGHSFSGNTLIGNCFDITGSQIEHWNSHNIDTANTIDGKPLYYLRNRNGGTISSSAGQVIMANCSNVIVENQNIINLKKGIQMGFSENNSIVNNYIQPDWYNSPDDYAVYIYESNNNTFKNNEISESEIGLYLFGSHDNNIMESNIYDTIWGLYIDTSHRTNISNNYIHENERAIHLGPVIGTTIANNNISNNGYGIYGISTNGNITGNDLLYNRDVIILDSSSNNVIYNNNISYNSRNGIIINGGSGNNLICNNHIISNSNCGIALGSTSENTISFNQIIKNGRGVQLTSSSNNLVYHNDFENNTQQAYDDRDNNHWNEHYPIGGNYWSDYDDHDFYKGQNRDKLGSDGFGDNNYVINNNAMDYYPLFKSIEYPYNHSAPVVYVGDDQVIIVNTSFEFEDSVFYDWDGVISTYEWDFGDGSYNDDMMKPIHTYSSIGTYNVYLSVTDNNGYTAKDTCIITVIGNHPPIAISGPDQTVIINETVFFTSSGSYDLDGPIVSYNWDFGDGTPNSHDVNPIHNYTFEGIFYVNLTVTDENGETISDICRITVLQSIYAQAGPNQTVYQGELVYFNGTCINYGNSYWEIGMIEYANNVGNYNSIAVDSNDIPHVSYYEFIPPQLPARDPLKYATRVGDTWEIQVVDAQSDFIGLYTSISVDSNDYPHISYFDDSNNLLKYVKWNGMDWDIITVTNREILSTSICLDGLDCPHIVFTYRYGLASGIRYVKWNGNSWINKFVDWGCGVSFDLDNNGSPHITYSHENQLKYATLIDNEWVFEAVDMESRGSINNILRTSISLDSNNYPNIAYTIYYFDGDIHYNLNFTRWDGNKWNKEIIDFNIIYGNPPYHPKTPITLGSMKLDKMDNAHLCYYDEDLENKSVKYAYQNNDNWHIEFIDNYENFLSEKSSSIAVDSTLSPHISYRAGLNDLKYATKVKGNISYSWDFGDGTFNSNEINPTYIYLYPGVYDVHLTVVDQEGNINIDQCIVTVVESDPPMANAGSNQTAYTWDAITFDGTASYGPQNSIKSYEWDFGDGTPHVFEDITTHVYEFPGVYYVTLNVTDSIGYYDTDICELAITYPPSPVAFAGSDRTENTWAELLFDGSESFGPHNMIETYIWDFGDGTSFGEGIVSTHVFDSPGVYNVTLTVTDTVGFTHSDICIVTIINPPPPIAIAGNDRVVYMGDDTDFDGSSSYGQINEIVQYEWNYGDGSEHCHEVNPSHIFTTSGIYNVTLTVTDKVGFINSDSCVVTVIDPPPPVADAGADQTVYVGDYFNLDGNGSLGPYNEIIRYDWDLDDGKSHINSTTFLYKYDRTGIYNITLIVTDRVGFTDSDTCAIMVIEPPPPVADAGTDQTVYVGKLVYIDGSGSYGPYNEIVNYDWNLDDGKPHMKPRCFLYIFYNPGIYHVTLTVTDKAGKSAIDACEITVLDPPKPVADAGPDQTIYIGEYIILDGSGSCGPMHKLENYEWDLGDGTQGDFGIIANHTFAIPGVYHVTLTVSDRFGYSASDVCVITVLRPPNLLPTAVAGSDKIVRVEDDLQFYGFLSYDPDGFITEYEWDFGDGGSSNQMNPIHSYQEPGTYQVKLKVTDNKGACGYEKIYVNVLRPSIAVDIGSDRVTYEGRSISFEAQIFSECDSYSYLWNFGDGYKSTDPIPDHIYGKEGEYEVVLTVTDEHGRTATDQLTVTVLRFPPSALTTANPNKDKMVGSDSATTPHENPIESGLCSINPQYDTVWEAPSDFRSFSLDKSF